MGSFRFANSWIFCSIFLLFVPDIYEIIELLGTPSMMQSEIEGRLAVARDSASNKRRQESLERDPTRTHKRMERLMTPYRNR